MESDVAMKYKHYCVRAKNIMNPPRITMGVIRVIRVSMTSDEAKRVMILMLSQGEEGNKHITHSTEGGNGDPHELKQQPLQSRVRLSKAQPLTLVRVVMTLVTIATAYDSSNDSSSL
jgi:hypothetical protein